MCDENGSEGGDEAPVESDGGSDFGDLPILTPESEPDSGPNY